MLVPDTPVGINYEGGGHLELGRIVAAAMAAAENPGSALLQEAVNHEKDNVREKYVDLTPMTEEEALVQTDLLGHDFYVFENATTGLVNVIYHRHNGGYGIIKPKIETEDGEA